MIDIDEMRKAWGINGDITPTSEDRGLREDLARTLLELEQARDEADNAYNRGFESGFENGFDAGREQAGSYQAHNS